MKTNEEIAQRLDKIMRAIQEEARQVHLCSRFLTDRTQFNIFVSHMDWAVPVVVDRTEIPESDDECKQLLVMRIIRQLDDMVGAINKAQNKLEELIQ